MVAIFVAFSDVKGQGLNDANEKDMAVRDAVFFAVRGHGLNSGTGSGCGSNRLQLENEQDASGQCEGRKEIDDMRQFRKKRQQDSDRRLDGKDGWGATEERGK